jgi:hypothetical protein
MMLCQAPTALGPAHTQVPPVFLNHVVIVVDSATYRAVAGSDLLRREFAGFEQRTTTPASGRTYSATYLYGQHTYIEFFQPFSGAPRVGIGQIALGVEERGAEHAVMERLAADGQHLVYYSLATRRRGAEDVPWAYDVTWLPDSEPARVPWFVWSVMEYHPEFLHRWYPDLPTDSAGVSRAAARAREWKPHGYLGDVVGVTFALDSADAQLFALALSAMGYAVNREADTLRARGPEIEFVLVPVRDGRRGALALRLALRRPKAGKRVYTFGASSVLRFGDGPTAIWTF